MWKRGVEAPSVNLPFKLPTTEGQGWEDLRCLLASQSSWRSELLVQWATLSQTMREKWQRRHPVLTPGLHSIQSKKVCTVTLIYHTHRQMYFKYHKSVKWHSDFYIQLMIAVRTLSFGDSKCDSLRGKSTTGYDYSHPVREILSGTARPLPPKMRHVATIICYLFLLPIWV